jgi:putative ATP-dependent endonuclease of OLD family
MFLTSLTVENFRGVREGRLSFDETTVLIGENDCGKSSLLDALAKALETPDAGPPRFEPQHFHRADGESGDAPAGKIRLELTFQERRAGEWDIAELEALRPQLAQLPSGSRQLALQLTAEPHPNGEGVVADWEVRVQDAEGTPSRNDRELLAAMRSLSPLILLRGGLVSLTPPAEEPAANKTAERGADLTALAEQVEAHYQALIAGASPQMERELEAGFRTARELLAHAPAFHGEGTLSGRVIAEILGRRLARTEPRREGRHGSAAQRIGTLILTAALLRNLPAGRRADVRPIVVIEDPEAHLHLMTLASVWGLIEGFEVQKIVTTQSETLLAAAPLQSVRRLTRYHGIVRQWRVREGALTADELRKLSYHLRARRGEATFARLWILVEGETEFWMLRELGHIAGYDFDLEGIACVEFAQCGIAPLVKAARELGIEWHLLADGDAAGRSYVEKARALLRGDPADERITALRDHDIEHCLFHHGYAQVYEHAAGVHVSPHHKVPARSIIHKALNRWSKPYMAFQVILEAAKPAAPGVPPPLRRMIETCVRLARAAPRRGTEAEAPLRRRARRPAR